jgi:transcription elongation factor GreB
MSRAFVKDDDDRPETPLERALQTEPHNVTPRGLQLLRDALADAERDQRMPDVRYYEAKINTAVVVDTKAQTNDTVGFGASVRVKDNAGNTMVLVIVGEEEAAPQDGKISYLTPYAQALEGHHVGERVQVYRPAGPVWLTIEGIEY